MSVNLNGHELPINKQAALSFAKSDEYKCKAPNFVKIYKSQPKTIPFPGDAEHDLTGKKVSRLNVVGFAGKRKWVVRCLCGNFEIRNDKRLRSLLNGQAKCNVLACFECMRFADKKRHYDFVKLGYNKHCNLDWYLR